MRTLMVADELAPVEARLAELSAEVRSVAEGLRAEQALRQQLAELAAELSLIAGPAFAALGDRLQEAEAKGWFAFARRSGAIADRVVTSFTSDEAYADPPSMVALLRRLHDRDVRRGLARTLEVLRAVGADGSTTTEGR